MHLNLEAFTMLCADETPMVRRAAAHKMRDFVSVCAKQATGTTEQVKVGVFHGRGRDWKRTWV